MPGARDKPPQSFRWSRTGNAGWRSPCSNPRHHHGQPRSTPIEQDQALLEQLVAALDLAELRQQASQLGAGLGTALDRKSVV